VKRKIFFVLLVVSALIVLAAVPAMASGIMRGEHAVVVRSATESLKVLVATVPAAPVNNYPTLPIGHYTCYFEGVRIPCEFLSWLWD
jgi:hypothetical protein